MIVTSGSAFKECYGCPITCSSQSACCRCGHRTFVIEYVAVPDQQPPLPKKEKLRKFIEKKNWKAIQDKHSRR